MKFRRLVVIGALAAQSWSFAQAQSGPDPDWKIERFNWNGEVTAGDRLEIDNPHGDVRVRPSNNDQVFVSAVIQRDQSDSRRADIQIVPEPGRLALTAGWNEGDGGAAEETDRMKRRRIDLTLLVPPGMPLDVRTRSGLIEAKGMANPVQARTVTGDIRLSGSKSVQTRSERGETDVTFTGGDWAEASVLNSVTGRITVWVSPQAGLTVRAETSGLITSDFSVQIERESAPTFKKKATAEIGAGLDELSLSSVKGDLRLLSLPR